MLLTAIGIAVAAALLSGALQLHSYARGVCDYALGLKRSIFWLARPIALLIALLLAGITLKVVVGIDLIGDALAGAIVPLCIFSALACLIAALAFVIGCRIITGRSDTENP